ncbi:MAG: UDP-N-acetylmuramate dehydrogenase [Candidatus Saelkia tenebricola]|nr:UDP-N-acetylmuramate dehydrogenase [Candidatus Saelkia tenebricola]
MSDKHIIDNYGYKSSMKFIYSPLDIEELKSIVKNLNKTGSRFRVIGGLSNTVLISKKSSLVIIKLKKGVFKDIRRKDEVLKVGAGTDISQLMNYCVKNGLGGLEFLVGIPGTIGGALIGNAGAYGNEIADFILNVDCLDHEGSFKTLGRKGVDFNYRNSSLKHFVVISVLLKITKISQSEIKKKMNYFINKRFFSQDFQYSSCGCFFKNPKEFQVGKIIDAIGLAGKKRGDVCVSDKHANFLINTENTNSEDILSLKDVLQRRIWRDKKVWLEPEVNILW